MQCYVTQGVPDFAVAGLLDKVVGDSCQRVIAALSSLGLSLQPKCVTVNLSPAALPKEGSHYDLPTALELLAAGGVTDAEQISEYFAVGSGVGPDLHCRVEVGGQ